MPRDGGRRIGYPGGMSDVTRLLDAAAAGDPQAAADLLPLVYDELRKLAAARLAREKPGQTLQATALVHEAYLRLVGGGPDRRLGRPRPLLRRRRRGHAPHPRRQRPPQAAGTSTAADRDRVDLDEPAVAAPTTAGRRPAGPRRGPRPRWPREDPVKAELVKLRYFAGLTLEEAAAGLGISPGHRQAALGLRPGLAVRRPDRPAASRGMTFAFFVSRSAPVELRTVR